MSSDLEAVIATGYGFEGSALTFGAAMQGEAAVATAQVRIPLAMMNRHGLVAGATGTGKTKTLQVLAEQLSDAGVPVFISDIKGDISGLAAPAELSEKLTARAQAIGFTGFAPKSFPVEFFTLDRDGRGVRLRDPDRWPPPLRRGARRAARHWTDSRSRRARAPRAPRRERR
jgi:hypothetical protein